MIAKDGVSRNSLANLVDLCCKGQVKVKEQIDRRDFLKRIGFGVVTLGTGLRSDTNAASKNKPNIVFMVADNLGAVFDER